MVAIGCENSPLSQTQCTSSCSNHSNPLYPCRYPCHLHCRTILSWSHCTQPVHRPPSFLLGIYLLLLRFHELACVVARTWTIPPPDQMVEDEDGIGCQLPRWKENVSWWFLANTKQLTDQTYSYLQNYTIVIRPIVTCVNVLAAAAATGGGDGRSQSSTETGGGGATCCRRRQGGAGGQADRVVVARRRSRFVRLRHCCLLFVVHCPMPFVACSPLVGRRWSISFERAAWRFRIGDEKSLSLVAVIVLVILGRS